MTPWSRPTPSSRRWSPPSAASGGGWTSPSWGSCALRHNPVDSGDDLSYSARPLPVAPVRHAGKLQEVQGLRRSGTFPELTERTGRTAVRPAGRGAGKVDTVGQLRYLPHPLGRTVSGSAADGSSPRAPGRRSRGGRMPRNFLVSPSGEWLDRGMPGP